MIYLHGMDFALRDNTMFLLLVAIIAHMAFAGDTDDESISHRLHGALPVRVPYVGKPYIVDADIFVSPGETVVLEPGVVLLFNGFTGLHCQGTLLANGTKARPIIFTSIKDSINNPATHINAAPYDWNGIDVYPEAVGTRFSWCRIGYSVYGIRSQLANVRLESTEFLKNGKTDFSIEGKPVDVAAGSKFSYGIQNKKPIEGAESDKPHQRRPAREFLRYSGIALIIGGAAVGLWSHDRFIASNKYFDQISADTPENKQLYSTQDWEQAKKKKDRDLAIAIAGYSVGLLGAIGFGVSFAF